MSADDDFEDIWTQSPNTSVNALARDFLSVMEHKIAALPAQDRVPFWDRAWISPELKDILFGPEKSGHKLHTYLILDATLRKNVLGTFELDALDVPVQCLFKGDAAEELKETAPYLIDVTLPEGAWDDPAKVPDFYKSFFADHWGQGTGIFIRSTASFADVWGHFRKFTRVQVEEDMRWVFFRFWDPQVIGPYFKGIRCWEDRARRFFKIPSKLADVRMIIEVDSGAQCLEIQPTEHLQSTENTKLAPFRFVDDDFRILEGNMYDRFVQDVSRQAAQIWPLRRRVFEAETCWQDEIRTLTKEAHDHGFTLDRDVRDFIAITLDKGKPFWGRKDVHDFLSQPHLNSRTLQMMAIRNQLETGALK